MTKLHFDVPRRPLGRARLAGVALALAVAMLGAVAGPSAWAQHRDHAATPAGSSAPTPHANNTPAERKLPADKTTDQTIELPGHAIHFRATAGSIPLNRADNGALLAEVAYIAYVVPGDTPRPVTFVFNGGPGAASAYLNLGAIGPWRLPLAHFSISEAPKLVPNAETWLDFTDLVFIDPPGTGYSRIAASGDEGRSQLWSVDGDAEALATFIRKWIEQAGRQQSLKFIAGESYGGFRAPKVAHKLLDQGVGIRGLVMISPVIDFANLSTSHHMPMGWVNHLPSMAAAALDAKGQYSREALREVERYAAGDYLLDLLKGERDAAAVARISERVAAYTGLDPALVKRLAGRVDVGTFQRELHRAHGLIGSSYDPNVTAYDPHPTSATSHFSDPVLGGTRAPITTAMTDLYQRVLNWRVDRPYELLNGDVGRNWFKGSALRRPQVVDDLRDDLAGDGRLRVLVVHGANDLVAPYFADQLLLQQLPVYGSADRVKLAVYAGGHMFYDRDESRRALHADAAALVTAASKPPANGE
jgi:carboxypeptidase C (cathepsin A)